MKDRLSDLIAKDAFWWCVALCAIVAVLFVTGAPTGGAFSWPDSPRHALSGAFVRDLVAAAPFADPVGWAYDYYAQYPALTILLYPPLFSFVLAGFYAVLGVSQLSAVIAVCGFYAVFACGAFFLARLWLSPTLAGGVALILVAAPEIAYWGRQVMLEIPAFAFLIWSAYFFIRHLEERKIQFLYFSLTLLICAIYTKLSVAFMGVPYALALMQTRGWDLLRDRHTYFLAALAVIGLIPLLVITLEFGQANVESVSGIADAEVARWSFAGWVWYARQMPSQLGWTALLAALAWVAVWAWPRPGGRPHLKHAMFILSWLGFGYVFFSAIDLKEARHSVFLLFPLALLAGLTIRELLPDRVHLASAAVLLVAGVTLAQTLLFRPVHYVDGYRQVVDFVAGLAPANSNIVFSGYRDGAFIFVMRAHGDRDDINVIRADKLLLRISVLRDL